MRTRRPTTRPVLGRPPLRRRQLPPRFLLVLLVVLQHLLAVADATVYVLNETYASLPGLFGRLLDDNKIYRARLQFLPDDPFLCDPPAGAGGKSSFVVPANATDMASISRGRQGNGGGGRGTTAASAKETTYYGSSNDENINFINDYVDEIQKEAAAASSSKENDDDIDSKNSANSNPPKDPVILMAGRGQ